jgi:hypothetical protein
MRSPSEPSSGTPGSSDLDQALGLLKVGLLFATWPGAGIGWVVGQLAPRDRSRRRFFVGALGVFLLTGLMLSGWFAGQAQQMVSEFDAVASAYSALLVHGVAHFDAWMLIDPVLRLWACGLFTTPLWAAYWARRPLSASELRSGSKAPLSSLWGHFSQSRTKPEAIRLGHFLGGDLKRWQRGGQVWLPTEAITKHMAVIGATGSGKTEALMRVVAELVALGWSVHYIDGKGDRELGDRFHRVMLSVGVEETALKTWPDQPFDFWRSNNTDRYRKLHQLAASDQPYYDNITKAVLGRALRRDVGAPDISNSRLFLGALAAAVDSKDRDQKSVLVKFEGVMQDVGHLFDGSWAFEDARGSYVAIDSLKLGDNSRSVAAAFLVEAARFASLRTTTDRPVLFVIDEFSAVGGEKALALVERSRFKRCAFSFSSQTIEGLGDPATANRLLGNCNVLAVFRTPNPEQLLSMLGTHKGYEIGEQLQGSSTTGLATRRLQHQWKVSPDVVRGLEDGEAILIHRGQYARLFVDRVVSP